MRSSPHEGRGLGAARRLAAVALLVLLASAGVAVAQDVDRLAIEERFEVIDLSDRLLLRPRAGEVLPQVEIPDGGEVVLVRGRALAREELAAELAELADGVAGLAALPLEERRELFGLAARGEEDSLAPVAAEAVRERRSQSSDSRVAFGRRIVVEEGEVASEVVSFAGSLEVRGRVEGDAVVIGGSATIEGEVTGDVVAVGGGVRLEEGASVGGEVVSVGGVVRRAPGAEIGGKVSEVSFGDSVWHDLREGKSHHRIESVRDESRLAREGADLLRHLLGLALLGLLVCLVLLVGRAAGERVAARAASEAWSAGLVGLLAELLVLPLLLLVVLVLVISVIGIPLLLLVPFLLVALLLAALVGYAGVALAVGRWLRGRFGWGGPGPFGQALVGVAAIGSLSLLGELLDLAGGWIGGVGTVIAVLGFSARYLAWTVGFGAVLLLLVSRSRARRAAVQPLVSAPDAPSTEAQSKTLPPIPTASPEPGPADEPEEGPGPADPPAEPR
jgi:cytoskeletal protein CcmA (bactofilin family)